MFCYQCEQTAKGQGCTVAGVCGKTADVANLQDLLVYKLRELSRLVIQGGLKDEKIGVFTAEALFVTLTNVNFDPEAIVALVRGTSSQWPHDNKLPAGPAMAIGFPSTRTVISPVSILACLQRGLYPGALGLL